MGPDGHTASLFPGAPTLDAGPACWSLATEDPNGRNPHPRLTLTLPAINSARLAVFTVAGCLQGRRGGRAASAATTSRRPGSTPGGRCGWSTAPRAPTPPRLASMLSDADLLRTPLADLTALARVVRDGAHGRRVTYSPKVFIPLTMLCRDRCGYCTFAKAPARVTAPYLTARGGAGHRPRPGGPPAATRPSSPWASGPSCATRWPRTGWPRRATPRRSTTSPPCAASSWRRPACSPTPTPARSTPTSWPRCARCRPARA